MLKLYLLSLTILMNSCGSFSYPIKFNIDESFLDVEKIAIKDAMIEWNKGIGMTVFEIGKYSLSPQEDPTNNESVITWKEGKFEKVDVIGRATWLNSCDVQIAHAYFDRVINLTLFKQVVLHELGHCICEGYHSPNPEDIMYWESSNGIKNLTINDINKAKYCLGLNNPGGGSGE